MGVKSMSLLAQRMFGSKARSVSSLQSRELDWSIVGGLAVSLALVTLGVLSSGKVAQFFDLSSILIVVGGTFGATLAHCSWGDICQAWSSLLGVIRASPDRSSARTRDLVKLSRAVRRDGTLVLEQASQRTWDPFFRLGLELAVDGQPSEEIRHILHTEMLTAQERAERSVRVFETMGTYAPALGLIGTLIGLIQMLGALNDPSTVGPAMAVALITTFYGAILANMVFLPIAGKLRQRHKEESALKSVTIEGTVSLARQESVVMLEQRLQSFQPGMARSTDNLAREVGV